MENIKITSQKAATTGGCGSYPSYTLLFENGEASVVEELDVPSVIMAIVLANRWSQAYEGIGIGEDAVIFHRGHQRVMLEEGHQRIAYSSNGKCLRTAKHYEDPQALFAKVNEVLEEIFHMESCRFEVKRDLVH